MEGHVLLLTGPPGDLERLRHMGVFEARVIDNEAEPPTETAGRVLELLPERWPKGVDDRSR
jgi:hypothetical protein